MNQIAMMNHIMNNERNPRKREEMRQIIADLIKKMEGTQ